MTASVIFLIAFHRPARAAQPPAECFGTRDINVCYAPWKVVAPEPGYSGVVLRKGPSFDADPIWNINTNQPVVISLNGHLARSSQRDGGVANGCPDPGPRPAVNGFIWGYSISYAKQGWMPWKVGAVTYAIEDSAFASTMCGPASFDFDCRFPSTACPLYHGCGGSAQPNSTCNTIATHHQVIVVGSTLGDLSQEKYYLRYGADSTTFGWFVPGDVVQRHCTASVDGFTWGCVTVWCAKYLPNGCRGWIRNDALGPAIPPEQEPPCFTQLPCPPGSGTCHTPRMDFDGDGDVDQADFGAFQKCISGPGFPLTPGCECFDRESGGISDGDVDSADFLLFQNCLSGADIPANPFCAP